MSAKTESLFSHGATKIISFKTIIYTPYETNTKPKLWIVNWIWWEGYSCPLRADTSILSVCSLLVTQARTDISILYATQAHDISWILA